MSFSHLLGQTQLEKVFEGIFPSTYEFFTSRGITGFLRSSHWQQCSGWEAGPPPRPQAVEAMQNKKSSNNNKRNPATKTRQESSPERQETQGESKTDKNSDPREVTQQGNAKWKVNGKTNNVFLLKLLIHSSRLPLKSSVTS